MVVNLYMTPKKYNRTSRRLKGYDYSNEGAYFVTIVTRNRLPLFGIIKEDEMVLNSFGEIAKTEWLKTIKIRTNISLGEYMIMPDHIHLVFHIDEQLEQPKLDPMELERQSGAVLGKDKIKNHSVSTVIRGYKAAITNQIKTYIHQEKDKETQQLAEKGYIKKQTTPLSRLISCIDLTKTIWVRGYHDIIIRDLRAYRNISQYVKDNPKNWKGGWS